MTERNRLRDVVCKRDRMHASAVNFALGFFGWPLGRKYEQVITIEASGVSFMFRFSLLRACCLTCCQFNNTLAPYDTCPNAGTHNKSDRSSTYIKEWAGIYLKEAQKRLQADLKPAEDGQGFNLEIEDVYRMQQMCAYEVAYYGSLSRRDVVSTDDYIQDCRARLFQILRAIHGG